MIESLDLNSLGLLITTITTIIGGIAAIREKLKNDDLVGAINHAQTVFTSVMDALNPNTEIVTVPDEIKSGNNSAIFKTTEKERNKIINGLPIAERLSVLNFIDNKEDKGCNYYTIETSKGVYTIENGYIDDFEPITKMMPKNYDDNDVGNVSIKSIKCEGLNLYNGIKLEQEEFIGKPIVVEYLGEAYGSVVVGAYYDSILLDKNYFNVNYQDGKVDIERATFNLPPYKESNRGNALTTGQHKLDFKIGYLSGYSTYNGIEGSSGDQVSWFEDKTVSVIVEVI